MIYEHAGNAKKIMQDIKFHSTLLRLELGMRPGVAIGIIQFIIDMITSGAFQNYSMKVLVLLVLMLKIYLLRQMSNCKREGVMVTVLVISEITNSAIGFVLLVNNTECLILYSQISALIFVFYQSCVFYNPKVLVIFAVKQTVMWSLIAYLKYSENVTSFFPMALSSLAVMALYLLITYCEYIKDIHLCRSKQELQQIHNNLSCLVKSISDIIIVINSSGTQYFTNNAGRKTLSYLSLKDYFSTSQYYRKNPSLNSNLSIFENIQKLFKKPCKSEVNFGIVSIDKVLIEWKGKVIDWNNETSIILCGRDVSDLVRMEKQSNENEYKN